MIKDQKKKVSRSKLMGYSEKISSHILKGEPHRKLWAIANKKTVAIVPIRQVRRKPLNKPLSSIHLEESTCLELLLLWTYGLQAASGLLIPGIGAFLAKLAGRNTHKTLGKIEMEPPIRLYLAQVVK